MLRLTSTGSYAKTEAWLKNLNTQSLFSDLERYGQMGVDALARATPLETGKSANSWAYKVTKSRNKATIEWFNTSTTSSGVPIVILLQYGHGTGTGGYVQGRDYINPAIRPIFEEIEAAVVRRLSSGK